MLEREGEGKEGCPWVVFAAELDSYTIAQTTEEVREERGILAILALLSFHPLIRAQRGEKKGREKETPLSRR